MLSNPPSGAGREIAVSVQGLGKRYQLSQQAEQAATLGEALLQRLKNPFARPPTTSFWAVRNVGFEIYAGDVVGVIGRNGAGKSTLLKLLSRITTPTEGRIDLWGRVGSLLEVGTGFHPELTGRENIFLNGAILGMTRTEIRARFEEIVEFAEISQFLDTPVKRYSSGMYVRLAFAVAAHLNPEILIVDEVLAVGDLAFQKKCLGKMQDVAKNGGRTVLFVSHNMAAVRSLCTRGLLMRQGSVALDTDVETAIAAYVQEGDASESEIRWPENDPLAGPAGSEARLIRACVLNAREEVPTALVCSEPFSIVLEYEVLRELTNLRVGFEVQNAEGVPVCGANDPEWSGKRRAPDRYRCRWTFPANTLNEGRYVVNFTADIPNDRAILRTGYDLAFSMEDTEGYGLTAQRLPGVLRPRLTWEESRESAIEAGGATG